MKKSALILTLLFAFVLQPYAQEEKKNNWTVVGNVQYVTQHHWRGIGKGPLFGNAPAFEPSVAFLHKNWNIGLFTAGSFDGVYKAAIPWVSFSPVKGLWIGVWDIYSAGKDMWTYNPFDYSLLSSKHFIDAVVSYRLPWIPLTLKWTTIVGGKDINPEDREKPDNEKRRNFTSYGELSYGHNWDAFSIWGCVGMTPFKGLYTSAVGADKAGINNIELKLQYNFKLYQPVSLPVFAKFTYNPLVDKFLFQAGASLTIPYTFK